jgi:hypothetical protein
MGRVRFGAKCDFGEKPAEVLAAAAGERHQYLRPGATSVAAGPVA